MKKSGFGTTESRSQTRARTESKSICIKLERPRSGEEKDEDDKDKEAGEFNWQTILSGMDQAGRKAVSGYAQVEAKKGIHYYMQF